MTDLRETLPVDPLGSYLHEKLIPVSSKKRPAYEAAREARRMVADELIFAAGEAATVHIPELGETLGAWIRRETSE